MPHVFLSHASTDQGVAEVIGAALKTLGISTWASFRDIPPGANWDEAIETALNSASAFIVVVTPASVQSRYVRAEVEEAIRIHKTVIPVIAHPAEIPLRWRTLQSVTWDSSQPAGSAQRITAGLPSTAAAQLLEVLGDSSRFGEARALVLQHTEWLPLEYWMAPNYAFRTSVAIDTGAQVDCFAGRLNSGGPRAFLYYLGSPYDEPISEAGTPSVELLQLLRVAKSHCLTLHAGLEETHQLAPENLFHERVDDAGVLPTFYVRFNVILIIGRRSHYLGVANEVRQRISREARGGLFDNAVDAEVEIMSYDRLLDSVVQSPGGRML